MHGSIATHTPAPLRRTPGWHRNHVAAIGHSVDIPAKEVVQHVYGLFVLNESCNASHPGYERRALRPGGLLREE